MSSEQHHAESGDENELRRLRHELELTRKELAAAVELHERAGTMIAEALGRHALTHQVGWLYEDYAADIRAIVDREERVAVENVVLKRQSEDRREAWRMGRLAGLDEAVAVLVEEQGRGGRVMDIDNAVNATAMIARIRIARLAAPERKS